LTQVTRDVTALRLWGADVADRGRDIVEASVEGKAESFGALVACGHPLVACI
jgi:hypothetical protein